MGSGWGGIGMGKPLSGQKSYVTEKYYKDEFMIQNSKWFPYNSAVFILSVRFSDLLISKYSRVIHQSLQHQL